MKATNILLALSLVLASSLASHAQVGIGTATPAASSVLDLTSTTQGLLVPRMTEAQRLAIATPANGLIVYQTDGSVGLWVYNGSTSTWTLSSNTGLVKGDVGLGNVDNTADADKPVSTATQTALDLKADLVGIDNTMVGLGNVDNTADADKPVSTATLTALDLKAPLESPTLVTPILGIASATSVNKVAITAPTTGATLTIADGSSLITAGGAFATTLTSTAATNVTLPTTGTLATTGTLVKVTSLTSGATTFTKQASTNMLVVYVVGAGGGGGGVAAVTGNSSSAAAGGGGGGEVRIVRVTTPSASAYTIDIGAGGTAGANTGGNGGTGGTTTWDVNALTGSFIANGGAPGTGLAGNFVSSTSVFETGGAGGSGGTGTGVSDASFAGFSGITGGPGGSPFGGFGSGVATPLVITGSAAGSDGQGFGAGGSGAVSAAAGNSDGNTAAGGTGAGGMILVYEYK